MLNTNVLYRGSRRVCFVQAGKLCCQNGAFSVALSRSTSYHNGGVKATPLNWKLPRIRRQARSKSGVFEQNKCCKIGASAFQIIKTKPHTIYYKKGDYHTVLKTENAKLKAYQALTTLKLNAYFFCYINFFNGKIHHKTLLCMCLKDDMSTFFADGSNMDFKIVHMMMVGSKNEHHFLFQYKCHNFSLLAL